MARWEEVIGKFGWLHVIRPDELPEKATFQYSVPWNYKDGGNGHMYIMDALGNPLFHVYCWGEKECSELLKKLEIINRT